MKITTIAPSKVCPSMILPYIHDGTDTRCHSIIRFLLARQLAALPLDDERNNHACSIENGCSDLFAAKKCPACDVETQAEPRFEHLE
jgi:hypothetical protein